MTPSSPRCRADSATCLCSTARGSGDTVCTTRARKLHAGPSLSPKPPTGDPVATCGEATRSDGPVTVPSWDQPLSHSAQAPDDASLWPFSQLRTQSDRTEKPPGCALSKLPTRIPEDGKTAVLYHEAWRRSSQNQNGCVLNLSDRPNCLSSLPRPPCPLPAKPLWS